MPEFNFGRYFGRVLSGVFGVKRSISAMIARGIDTDTAENLSGAGHTLRSLSSLTRAQLDALALPPAARKAIRNLKRPPVPASTLLTLLYECGGVCCICRAAGKGVIVHHIVPWNESRSHDPSNLVILCLEHHDEAHTRRELSHSLTATRIRHAKEAWTKRVKELEVEAVFEKSSLGFTGSMWDYFNPPRLFEVAKDCGLKLSAVPSSPPHPRELNFRYENRFCDDTEYKTYSKLVRCISDKRTLVNLRSIWTKTQMDALLRPGTIMALYGHFRFKDVARTKKIGPGQIRRGYLQRRGIRIEFTLDAWEATTSSSWSHHLGGGWMCTAICVLRSATQIKKLLKLDATVLAIGTGFGNEEPLPSPSVAYARELELEKMQDEEDAEY